MRATRGAWSRTDPARRLPWTSDDLNLVRVRGCAAAEHRFERVALDGPVASLRDRQDVAHDALGRHASRPSARTREQRLVGLTLGDRDRLGLR